MSASMAAASSGVTAWRPPEPRCRIRGSPEGAPQAPRGGSESPREITWFRIRRMVAAGPRATMRAIG